jgi:hypothetical protein
MNNEKERSKRDSYKTTSPNCDWNKLDKVKFASAVDKYGYSPTANRKIADEVGLHPNQ